MNRVQDSTQSAIQQTLHGYAGGHRLLATSQRLPKDAERLLLLLSDLSGPTGGEQFEPYLTGYPVDSIGCYALARTWPAPEMPRPGCVWTHTLLIAAESLATLHRPESLLTLFRLPSDGFNPNDYRESLSFPRSFESLNPDCGDVGNFSAKHAATIIHSIYSTDLPHTVLSVPKYSTAESLLLAVWRLQWASLRQRFTFCSGSLAPRHLEGRPFVLQASLERDLRRHGRDQNPPTIVSWTTPESHSGERWVKEAADACNARGRSPLYDFIENVGTKLSGLTTYFRPVVQAHLILHQSSKTDTIADLIDFTANQYPEPQEGREYKLAFFGKENSAKWPEWETLRGLAQSSSPESFDIEDLAVRKRSEELWESNAQAWQLLKYLLRSGHGAIAEEIVAGLSSAIPGNFLHAMLEASPELIAGVLSHNPGLASSTSLWANDPAKQQRAAAALMLCGDAVVDRIADIIGSALLVSADPTDPSLIDVFGPSSVPIIMDWLEFNLDNLNKLPEGWRRALAKQVQPMLEWLGGRSSVRPVMSCFVLENISTDVLRSSPLGLSVFARKVPQEGTAPDSLLVPLAGRLLRVSLVTTLPEAVDLAVSCFDIVYSAAAESRLPDNIWHDLSWLMPEGYWWEWEWDRCSRLRRGIAEKFRTEQWPAIRLTEITKNDTVFGGIVAVLKERRSGRRVLEIAADATGLSAQRKEILHD
jgi:hypothetical protein